MNLEKEIDLELESMAIIVSDIKVLIDQVGNKEPTNIHKTALGGFASQFYNGIENIIKRIYKAHKIPLPKGDNWHIILIDRLSKNSDKYFPVKIEDDLLEKIADYRRFRHYFFHGYSHNLNWDILSDGVKDIDIVFNDFQTQIKKQI